MRSRGVASNEINGRRLLIFTDHKPIVLGWKNPNLQVHDNIAMNAINEIAQWTSEIQHKAGKDLIVPDLLSRPPGNAYEVHPEDPDSPEYIPPSSTMAALEMVALNVVSPEEISKALQNCPDVEKHKKGLCPKSVKMEEDILVELAIFKPTFFKMTAQNMMMKDRANIT